VLERSSDIVGDLRSITVEAPDPIGLLWAIAAWFQDNGVDGTRAFDTFLVQGDPDVDGLAACLAGRERRRFGPWGGGRR
jgi:hypothetical protein